MRPATADWAVHGFHVHRAEWAFPGKGHDRALVLDHFAGVADGASPLGPAWADPGPFAQQALEELARAALDRPGQVTEVFTAALEATGRLARAAPQPASCTVAVAWLDGDVVEIGVLGDALALVTSTDGSVVRLTDRTVADLDARVLDVPELDRARMRREHRNRANTPEGYWIYGDAPEAAHHVVRTRLRLTDVRTVCLCTDGLQRVPELGAMVDGTAAPDERRLADVLESVRTRSLDGREVAAQDDEAVVTICRG
jgi:serine/threonine protein phosphatase PrpC